MVAISPYLGGFHTPRYDITGFLRPRPPSPFFLLITIPALGHIYSPYLGGVCPRSSSPVFNRVDRVMSLRWGPRAHTLSFYTRMCSFSLFFSSFYIFWTFVHTFIYKSSLDLCIPLRSPLGPLTIAFTRLSYSL